MPGGWRHRRNQFILYPLFSGLPESIFHADPHAGNLIVQTQKHAPLTLVLLNWSQAGWLSAPLRHALIALYLYCVTGAEPLADVLRRLLESNRKSIRANALGSISAGTIRKAFVHMQKTCWRISEIRASVLFRSSGIIRSPHHENKEKKKAKKHEC